MTPSTTPDDGPGGPGRWAHEVPTHLDVQDRALLGLTVRQVLCLASAAACGFGLVSQLGPLPLAARLGLATAVVCAGLVLALVRPGGRGLEAWALAALRFGAAPRRTVWVPSPAAAWSGLAVGSLVARAGRDHGEALARTADGRGPATWAELVLSPAWHAMAPGASRSGALGELRIRAEAR